MSQLIASPLGLTLLSVGIAMCFVTWPLPVEASKLPVGTSMFIIGIVYIILTIPLIAWQGWWPAGTTPNAYRLVVLAGAVSLIGTGSLALLAFLTVPSGKFPDYFLVCLVAQIVTTLGLKLYWGTPMNAWHVIAFIAAAVVAVAGWKAGL